MATFKSTGKCAAALVLNLVTCYKKATFPQWSHGGNKHISSYEVRWNKKGVSTTIVGRVYESTCSFPGAHLSDNFDIWKLFVVNPKHQELMKPPTNQRTKQQACKKQTLILLHASLKMSHHVLYWTPPKAVSAHKKNITCRHGALTLCLDIFSANNSAYLAGCQTFEVD